MPPYSRAEPAGIAAGGTLQSPGPAISRPVLHPGAAVASRRRLLGAFAGLIVVIVVGAMFITAEYRRGLIRVTLAASPAPRPVLPAKAAVIGPVTFAPGWPARPSPWRSAIRLLRASGSFISR